MDNKNCFEFFEMGKVITSEEVKNIDDLEWKEHPKFQEVSIKDIFKKRKNKHATQLPFS